MILSDGWPRPSVHDRVSIATFVRTHHETVDQPMLATFVCPLTVQTPLVLRRVVVYSIVLLGFDWLDHGIILSVISCRTSRVSGPDTL